MTSIHISNELREAIHKRGVNQVELSKKTFRAPTTLNGYFNKEPTPLDAVQDIANVLDDSTLTHKAAHKTFGTLPVMDSDTYQEHPLAVQMLHQQEEAERTSRLSKAMMILTKHDHALSKEDKEELLVYVNEFLDEILTEMKLVFLILDKINISFMVAVKKRTPYWIAKNYLIRK